MATVFEDTGPDVRALMHQAVTSFRWRYDTESPRLRTLYEKSKKLHWNGSTDLDWSIDVDPEDELMPDAFVPIYGSDIWHRMTPAEKVRLRVEGGRYTLSQFLHGEQGALICTAQIACSAPNTDAKFYAAQQVADEARHVEVYGRYLNEKLGGAAPIDDPLWALLEDTVRDSRPDMTQLGMQVMVEGLALAWFSVIQTATREPLLKKLIRLVMNDESRHVAFGVLYLKDAFTEMSSAELREREEFVVQCAHYMRDRLLPNELWHTMGLPADGCNAIALNSPVIAEYRKLLFSRIVPNLKRIGLLTPYVRERLAPLDILKFEDLEPDDAAGEADVDATVPAVA